MNEKVGQVSFPEGGQDKLYKPYSDETAKLIDDEVRELVAEAYDRTKQLLVEHKDKVEAVAKMLLEKEVITTADVVACIGERPFEMPTSYQEIVDASWTRDEEKSNMADPKDNGEEATPATPTPAAACTSSPHVFKIENDWKGK